MKIASFFANPQIQTFSPPKQKQFAFRGIEALAEDTFVSQAGNYQPDPLEEERFLKFLNSELGQDLLKAANERGIKGTSKKEKIVGLINKSMDENKIGEGTYKKAFKILRTNYVVAVDKFNTKSLNNDAEFSINDNVLKDRINLPFAAVNNNGTAYELAKYLKGVQNSDFNIKSPNYLKLIANMPQSAYDDFLVQAKTAVKYGYEQDNCGRNLIISAAEGKLELFDYNKNPNSYLDPARSMLGILAGFPPHNFKIGDNQKFYDCVLGKILITIAKDIEDLENPELLSFNFGENGESCFGNSGNYYNRSNYYFLDFLESLKQFYGMKLELLKNPDPELEMNLINKISYFCNDVQETLLGENHKDLSREELIKLSNEVETYGRALRKEEERKSGRKIWTPKYDFDA